MKGSYLTPRPPSLPTRTIKRVRAREGGDHSLYVFLGSALSVRWERKDPIQRRRLPTPPSLASLRAGREGGRGVRSLHQVFALALVEALRQLLGVVDPGPAALEEAVVLREDGGDQAARGAAHDVDLGEQRQVRDSLAVVFHDLLHDLEGGHSLGLGALMQGQQLVDAVAADEHGRLALLIVVHQI